VRVTIALWLTPNSRLINDTGLTPDIEVLLTEDDLENDHDSQLMEAIRVLLEEIDAFDS
jgi:carboxyl-terminal processing protease